MQIIIRPLEWIMNFCYGLCHNYAVAIVLFTLISKIVLLPVSISVQKNSIKMVKMLPELNDVKAKYYGDGERISEEEFKVYKKYHYSPFVSMIPMLIQLLLLMGVIEVIKAGINSGTIDMNFMGFSLAVVPFYLSPILAALSALIMCVCQNASNVLQAEQSKKSQIFTLLLSVGLSLYLGIFVSVGVAIYWIFSNLFAVVQLYLLNMAINPKKFVDYAELERSKKALAELESLGGGKKDRHDPKAKEYAKREKQDYKRFFSIVNKHLVFYSESNGFYKYYAGLIEYLLDKTNLVIHYITSDPEDLIFEKAKTQPRIKPYYIAEKRLITLMMKMDADIVVMTMPDLNNYHIKRSYVRNDIEYLYIPHCLDSLNMTMRKGSMDHFDSVLCAGKSQMEEITQIEKAYGLKPKRLIECGYFLLDDMIEAYGKMDHEKKDDNKMILIAPSWQEDNIVDSCLDALLDQLKTTGYRIVVRPHPQHVRHKREKLEKLRDRFADNDLIEIQLDFSATDTVWKADLLITDWSGITYEYCYCTHRPVLFINTPMKVMNPEYQKIDYVPINIAVREVFGASVDVDNLDVVPEIVYNLIGQSEKYEKVISDFVQQEVYNLGHSAEVGGKYIMKQLMDRKKKENEKEA